MRETKRRNRDGSVVSYLQLAHSERHPVTGVPQAKVIHNFGRAEAVDRDGLARLVSSISRFLDPQQAIAAAHAGQIEVLGSRRFGGAWLLDQLWDRLGIGRRCAGSRRVGGSTAVRPSGCCWRWWRSGRWRRAASWPPPVGGRAGRDRRLPGFSDDSAYAAMDFLLDALGEIAAQIFDSVAHLLNLDVDIVFVDTTSTYWEVDGADEWADLQPDPQADDGAGTAVEGGQRRFGKSQGPPRRPASGGDRDGGHPRRHPGALLDISRQRERPADHPHGQGRPGGLAAAPAEDLAAAYKQLIAVERGWRDCKSSLGLRPVYHHREDRIRAHVQLCWLALLLIRIAETRAGDTWRNLRHELDRMHLVTLATADGRVAQRSALTSGHKTILAALDLPEPPRYLDFTPGNDAAAD